MPYVLVKFWWNYVQVAIIQILLTFFVILVLLSLSKTSQAKVTSYEIQLAEFCAASLIEAMYDSKDDVVTFPRFTCG